MYLRFFNLREQPFNLTPDPRFLFLSPQHEEALSHLLYGIQERKGFIEITGEVGTGKTILCRALLDRLDDTVSTALIFNSYLNELELLQAITHDFGLTCQGTTRKGYIDTLNAYLLKEFAAGRNAVVLIDEAQNLEPRVLEQLRMLSNLETERGKLLQVVLIGQPELRDRLNTPQMRQLDQRIAVRCHIHSLTRAETQQYITHRLSVAGMANAVTFTSRALSMVYQHCTGIPRRINLLCDRILAAAYVEGTHRITARLVRRSLQDLGGSRQLTPRHVPQGSPVMLYTVIGVLLGFGVSLLGVSLVLPAIRDRLRPVIPTRLLASAERPPPPALPQPANIPPAPAVQSAPPPPRPQPLTTVPPLARTLRQIKSQMEERLAYIQTAALGSRARLQLPLQNGKGLEIMPIQVGFPQLRRVSRPCFIEVVPEATDPSPVLWVLIKSLQDRVLIYQETEGVVSIPIQQLRRIWYGKLYLTLETGAYGGEVLRQGMNGSRVQTLQHALKDLGYFDGLPSGQFDTRTHQAVMSFQRDNQLVVDGQIGWQTLMMLLHVGGLSLDETT